MTKFRRFTLPLILVIILVVVLIAGAYYILIGSKGSNYPNPLAKIVPTQALTTDQECQVKNIQTISKDQSTTWLAQSGYQKVKSSDLSTHADQNGIWQVYKVDTSSQAETCLTCQSIPGGPSSSQHKRYAYWDPSHKWIIVDGEMSSHPQYPSDRRLLMGAISNGLLENFYALSPDGNQWHNLTNYTFNQIPPGGDLPVRGAFDPKFTHDGTKVVWTVPLVGNRTPGSQLGKWELWMAEYKYDNNGVPYFDHITNITPKNPQGNWFEPHDFSLDDKYLILTSDMNNPSYQLGQDIFRIDISSINLDTGDISHETVQDLTNTPYQWDEHAFYSPNGQKIIWSSSSLDNNAPKVEVSSHSEDIMMMDADGSNKFQLTHFNTQSGYPESTPGVRTIPNFPVWSKDGSQILVTVGLAPNQAVSQRYTPPQFTGAKIWLVTLQGKCGG